MNTALSMSLLRTRPISPTPSDLSDAIKPLIYIGQTQPPGLFLTTYIAEVIQSLSKGGVYVLFHLLVSNPERPAK